MELKTGDPHGRLVRLLKYTEGEARAIKKHYIQFNRLQKLGIKRQRILAAYRKEIRVWPSLKNGDSAGYRRFYNFLI